MTHDEAIQQLSHLGRRRAFGRHVGSDRLIQAGLDALLAGVAPPRSPEEAARFLRERPPGERTD
ncbi:hypothetical protein R6L23_17630 [Streptomyces sp. SR27]|uniref:hypothetical protein n=1 Tax=Streptomyces sp. SR27 TaxID=3076630 RepID=UPI00295C2BF4|nr:hypothetical protein [Streptomyces sp. SR27]MDV9190008.1 hypothetical protein [Streptomyces sp. SR27]